MADLLPYQYLLIGLLFVWGGFVRSGLGFGGAVLTLPFLLLILNQPLVFLPILAVHLLVFSGLTVYRNHRSAGASAAGPTPVTTDWGFVKYALRIMIIPKLIGVIGVITLPAELVSGFIFLIVSVYSVSYILNRPFRSNSKTVDAVFLALGGYVSGTSLVAAPLVVPVAASRVDRYRLRDTLFALWFILVSIKMAAFIWAGIDLQLAQNLWLLPCGIVGHVIGLRFHAYTLRADTSLFFRAMGAGLLAVSLVGLWRALA